MKFLKDKELDYGPLWCVYCGKEGLKIYDFHDKKRLADMATADHVIPKSFAPDLARNKKNLRVSCWHCNTKKGSSNWPEKFPYD
jgi:5-methylcytosine-specific restriction endonuclease McrA